MSDDYSADTSTTATVAVGGSATGEIETARDRDWFAVDLVAGRTYVIDIEGADTDAGTLDNPLLRRMRDPDGDPISGTRNDNGGTGNNARLVFTATETDTYYIEARGHRLQTGTYTVTVTEDISADSDTTGTVEVGGSASGSIETLGDRDWYAVELEAGTHYRIELEGSPTNQGTLDDPYLHGIYDADGDLIVGTSNDDGGTGRNSEREFVAETTGTYYISAGAYESPLGRGWYTGTYQLSVSEVPDDFSDDTDTTGTVAVGGSATGLIEKPGDRDWFAVELEAGTSYRIELEGWSTRQGTLDDTYLRGIYDADGNLVSGTTNDNGGTGTNSEVVFVAETSGTYYISAGAYSGPYGLGEYAEFSGSYRLSVSETEDDFSDDTDTTGTVTVGGSATGKVNYFDDRDWFAVELEAGTRYRIKLEGSDTSRGTTADPYLRGVYDADGNRVAGTTDNDSGTGRNSEVTFVADEAGTYYISAGAFESAYGRHAGTYRLSVSEVVDDFPEDADTTGTVAVGGSTTGEIDHAGDRDWFAVELEAGTHYRIELEGSPTDQGTLSDPYLRGIYNADGTLISGTTNDDSGTGRNSEVAFVADEAGTHYISAGAYNQHTGTYRLSVSEVTDDFLNNTDTTGTVAVGGSATGEVNYANDRDWFAVELEAGTRYVIELEGSRTSQGTLADPYLRGIYDADGNPISGTTDDDSGVGLNSEEVFLADEAGTYYIAAGAGRDTGTYRLSVSEAADDFSDDTDTTGTVTVGGSATGEIDFTGDRDWFAVDLVAGKSYSISLEGSRTGQGTLRDPYLRGIYDADGTLIPDTSNDDGGEGLNSLLTFDADVSGTYYIEAGVYGRLTGTYRLSIAESVEDGL